MHLFKTMGMRRSLPLSLGLLVISTLSFHTRVSAQKIDASDVCREGACPGCSKIDVSSSCAENSPLADGRDGLALVVPGQCRTFCDGFSNDKYSYHSISSKCTYCQEQEAYDKYAVRETYLTDDVAPQYCVPRGVCIEKCGPEPAGCIYTGTCGSLICFEGKDSEKPATLKRATYDGPGTVLLVDNTPGSVNGTLHSTDAEEPSDIPHILDFGYDYCAALGVGFEVDDFSCDNAEQPIGNSTVASENVQCRNICADFDRSNYEVLRLSTQCNFCNSQDAEEFISTKENDTAICIPQSKCRAECGQEPQGCVYTGSCRSLICFSGLESKKPASLSLPFDTGASSSISVDNSGDPISEDPAAFNANLPSPTPTASPSPSPKPSPASHSSESTKPNDGGTSNWVWLGPVIGIVALAVIASAIIAVYIAKKRRAASTEVMPQ